VRDRVRVRHAYARGGRRACVQPYCEYDHGCVRPSRRSAVREGAVKVSVVWATAAIQDVVEVEVLPGATIADALARSGLVARYALDPAMLGFAVFGRRAWSHTALADGDRVELTRPLEV